MDATAAGAGTGSGLDLLASAIAGRPVGVAAAGPGELPWTDGTVVFVGGEASRRDRIRAVAVQASLLGAGSLGPEIAARLRRRGALARRYLAVEGHRALAAHEAVLPPQARALVDRSTAARSASPAGSLALALSRAPIADPPAEFGAIRPGRLRAGPPAGSAGGAAEHVPRRQRDQLLRELDDGEDTGSDGASGAVDPVGGGGAVGRLLARLLGPTRTRGGGPPGADAPTHRTRRAVRPAHRAAVSTTRAALPDGLDGGGRQGVTYPEWNVHERRYRPGWCTVAEVRPEPTGPELPVPPDTGALRRSLARLGLDLERRHRQLEGDDVDVDALVEARAALAAGSAPGEAVYIGSVRSRRDLSVLILLDVSGSAGEPGVTGGSGGRVHEHQVRAAAGLTVALHDLGDRVALYGFRSQGRRAVRLLAVKRFGDGLDAAVLRRLGGLAPGAYTRLGAAIRHGASVLETEGGTARRLLVVLSDGFAYDHGYDGPYGEADARRALAEARRRGTACLCLSVAADTDAAALRRVFGPVAHASVPHARRLPATVGPLFRSSLRLADGQRRLSQRRKRARERIELEGRTA